MLNASLFRLPSTELKAAVTGKKLALPFPCLSLMGAEVAARFGLTGPAGEPLIPKRIYIDKFDPITFLRYWPFSAEAICENEVQLPKQVVQLHATGAIARDETDQLSTAARDLMTAIVEYKAKFIIKRRQPDGSELETEKTSTSDRQESYKASIRAGVQRAFLNYQFRQLNELKRVLRKQVFQTVHPGCFAPLVPDPLLAIDQVRIPSEIWGAFRDNHALVLRHPVLEVLYRLKPVKGSEMAIGLHPLLFDKIGADCVSGSSPIVLRHNGNYLRQPVTPKLGGNAAMATKTIVPTSNSVRLLEELAPTEGIHLQHNLDVLNHNGDWVPCRAVIRKAAKPMLRITQRHSGVLEVTPDHQVRVNGLWRKAGELKVGECIDTQATGHLVTDRKGSIYSPDEMRVMGLWLADGYAGSYTRAYGRKGNTRYEWRISNTDTAMLEQARQIMQDSWGIPLAVQSYPSEVAGSKTSLGVRRYALAHLVVSGAKRGEKKNLVLWFIQNFHDEQGRKKLPYWLFDEPSENIRAFLDGWFCGDGDKGKQLKKGSFSFTIESPALVNGIKVLAERIGMTFYVGKYHRGSWNVRLGPANTYVPKSGRAASFCRKTSLMADDILSIEEIGEQPCFDVMADGEFVAGAFNVHNCDGDTVFVTPLPKHLDGGQVFIDPSYLVYDEANVLLEKMPQGHARHLPVDCPPLTLHDFGPQSELSKFVGEHGIRNFKNAVWAPMDDQKYFEESMAAAARFRWEKDSIGRADWVRRTLEILTDDVDVLRAINRFCSVVSQKAIDAGKHRDNFPLEQYMQAFRCRFEAMGNHGPYKEKFATAVDMATELVSLTGLRERYEDVLKVCEMLFSWPEFQELGMQGLVERYYPWWAIVSKKRMAAETSGKMLYEAKVLLNQDSALAGMANLFW